MPALIDGHAHLGYQGPETWGAENYGRENLIENLQRLQNFVRFRLIGGTDVLTALRNRRRLTRQTRRLQASHLEGLVTHRTSVSPAEEIPTIDVVRVSVPVVVHPIPRRLALVPPEVLAEVDVRRVDSPIDHRDDDVTFWRSAG